MRKRLMLILLALLAFSALTRLSWAADDLGKAFVTPPPAARPWVYWFWLNSNLTKDGITTDLEAMARVGIGGVLIMEVDQGAPVGPVAFGSPQWRELFQHVCREADRLGLEVNMTNDAGWCGSGGPWITPQLSMQKIVSTQVNATGPSHFAAALKQPETVAGYYEDFSVIAFPTPAGNQRIADLNGKNALERRDFPAAPATYPAVPAEQTVPGGKIVDLTAQCKNGQLTWDVPEGTWTIVRLGHTSTGKDNHPAPATGRGLECDKLSKPAVDAMFAGLMGKIIADSKPLAGKSLVTTHIDSWEVHSQNWSPLLREEFQKRCGYDPYHYLPVLTGYVVDSAEVSERFLWDWRQTLSDVLVDNYAGHFAELARQNNIKLSIEAYGDGAFDNITYGGRADEPMGEFWSWAYGGANESVTEMTSAGHVYGKRIIGAESFTATDAEKWLGHPAFIKSLGDWAFCEGINRFVFHRYAMQPWTTPTRAPGMSMGPWGLHYERTQTWWEQSKAWHCYLARCQHLLRQGLFVADICYLQPQGAPRTFGPPAHRTGSPPDRPGYNFDGCSTDVVLTRMSVKDGLIVLPDGMSYRLLVLPESQTMTLPLLTKIAELVEAGAIVVGPRPQKSPSLIGFPDCDQQVQKLADRVWGDCDGKNVTEHALGKGKIVWGVAPEKVLAVGSTPEDFACAAGARSNIRFIHRHLEDGTELYFVANKKAQPADWVCSFRVAGKRPELWYPETGRRERAAAYEEKAGVTQLPLHLDATESVFVVFRPGQEAFDSIVALSRDGQLLQPAAPSPAALVATKAIYGIPGDAARTRDVTAKVQGLIDGGQTTFLVATLAAGDDPAYQVVKTLELDYTIKGKPHHATGHDTDTIKLPTATTSQVIAIQKATYGVPGDAAHTRDVKAKLQTLVDTGEATFPVTKMAEGDDPAFGVYKTLTIEYTADGKPQTVSGMDGDEIDLDEPLASKRTLDLTLTADGHVQMEASKPGHYEFKTAAGKTLSADVPNLPEPQQIAGAWDLQFPAGAGAPEKVALDKLISWSTHETDGVKYFSGTGTYRTTFDLRADLVDAKSPLYLDLGKVAVMAEVKLNGHDLGILWKPPYRVAITDAAKAGANTLEVKVTNLWINRQIGDEQLPEDSDRNGDGTLKAWPQWLQEGKPSPTGRFTFTSWRLWKKDAPLQESGLLGPVTIQATRKIVLEKP